MGEELIHVVSAGETSTQVKEALAIRVMRQRAMHLKHISLQKQVARGQKTSMFIHINREET